MIASSQACFHAREYDEAAIPFPRSLENSQPSFAVPKLLQVLTEQPHHRRRYRHGAHFAADR
ncbi:hypothetical protein [Streptomyces pseudovenezuelae]|uniref:Uncharacterized protein n=1 Tax=Streptomyces pseudovenezuelae TaxID=67350 RepID=A0ABT6LUC6_9ACTN|nr:hypothetical protein [Streptomyces pseudovenezuelae]